MFLDTGYHFAETLWYVEQVRRRYDLNLRDRGPDVPTDDRWLTDPDGCCAARKVGPLDRALAGKAGVDERAAPRRGPQPGDHPDRGLRRRPRPREGQPASPRGPTSTSPGYIRDHDLPVHPLADRGYASIGCWPCTRPVADGDDPRAGRWAGTDKTECGLHG